MRQMASTSALVLCLGVMAHAQEVNPEYRITARFDERILQTFGPFDDPAALIVGKSMQEGTVLLLRDMKVVKRVPKGREGNVTVGASANGRFVALVERVGAKDKRWWEDPNAKWQLTLEDR